MTEYVSVDIQHVAHGSWRAYIKRYDEYVSATSQSKLEYETYRVLEEAYGLRSFVIVWAGV